MVSRLDETHLLCTSENIQFFGGGWAGEEIVNCVANNVLFYSLSGGLVQIILWFLPPPVHCSPPECICVFRGVFRRNLISEGSLTGSGDGAMVGRVALGGRWLVIRTPRGALSSTFLPRC